LKGERCFVKCPIDKPAGAVIPGQHGKRRSKLTEYGKRLREKQKTRRISGLLERPFYNYFRRALRMPGQTGENLLKLLETRLDNVVRRLGFAGSMSSARQIVSHGNVKVNGVRINIPSYGLKVGDVVSLADSEKGNVQIQRSISSQIRRDFPSWLELNPELSVALSRTKDLPIDLAAIKVEGRLKIEPTRAEMSYPVNDQYIVELYSK
jgi:small subunit ribosomal protein S4